MTTSPGFIHLRLHTEFSLVDSVVRIKPLINRVKELGMPAVGITDQCNFYGLIKFYSAAQSSGVKPIMGADFWLRDPNQDDKTALITLLAMNNKGYKNIIELISRAYQKGQYLGQAFIQREWISECSEDVIALSGGRFGDIGQALISGRETEAASLLAAWQRDFPNRFYLELQRTGRENEDAHIFAAVKLAAQQQVPVVATNDVRFLSAEDFETHEARVCIGEGRTLDDPKRPRRYSEQQFLRSPKEMALLFADIPQALENSVEIAKRCSVDIELGKYYLPEYPIPEGFEQDPFFSQRIAYAELENHAITAMTKEWAGKEQSEEYLAMVRTNVFFQKLSYEGMYQRLDIIFANKKLEQGSLEYDKELAEYSERLQYELNIIMQMGFPGYFLIVMDFIQWAKEHDIPVGPGRGSGAGSLVAYALMITDLDPLEYDLLFERFLNPERVSMPDFDIDFCMDDRDRVINYVSENYGRDAVSQIITFGTMAAKAVVRDVTRIQDKPFMLGDKLSKLIPPDPGMTLDKAHEQEELLREFLEQDEDAREIWEMSLKLEGITRNVGKHAGGVVIAPTKLTDFSPLYCDETGKGLVTQYDKNDVESAGLVKFDFLGLRTLTIIDWAVAMVNTKRRKQNLDDINIDHIDLADKATFEMLKTAETTAVFQLESRGMKDLVKRLSPDDIEDMTALVALFRPGPLQSGMVDDFINRKHGRAEVAYPDAKYQHKKLKPILEPTYGVIVYQEQVMQIAQELAGYTLGGADLLRRAMGKKKPEEMAKQRAVFEEGAAGQGVDPILAMKIFDLVEKFAGYGFNKSHSAAYAVVSYQTAWLKTHYPSEFMAATMSSDMDKTDKVVTFIEECRSMGLTLLPPDVNQGEFQFTVDDDQNIIYGLGAIKGLGEGPVEAILKAREGGAFSDIFDFCARVDTQKVNKRSLEALIRSGAFDEIAPNVPVQKAAAQNDKGENHKDQKANDIDKARAIMMIALPEAVKAAEQNKANQNAGMIDLFADAMPGGSAQGDVYADFMYVHGWSMRERLNGEKDTLGLYLTGHPIDEYKGEIKYLVSSRIADIRPGKETVHIAGLVVDMRVMKNKKGETMGFIALDDRSGRLEVAVFADTFNEYREKLVKDTLLIVEGKVSHDDYSGGLKMRATKVTALEEARFNRLKSIHLLWQSQDLKARDQARLFDILEPYRVLEQQNLAAANGIETENNKQATGCEFVLSYQRADARAEIRFPQSWALKPADGLTKQLREVYGANNCQLNY